MIFIYASFFFSSSSSQGTGPEVPKFLRFEGQVRNRRLGKRDTALLIKDIWQEKAAHDAEVLLMDLVVNAVLL